jgi:ribokinase
VLVVSASEACLLSGRAVDDEDSARDAGTTLARSGCETVVIPLGGAGLLCTAGEIELLPAPAVRAVDTTAAGDAFVGALAVGMAASADLHETARLATLAGGHPRGRPGLASKTSGPHACSAVS